MSDTPQGPDWWVASDGRWYAPELHPDLSPGEPTAPPAASEVALTESGSVVTEPISDPSPGRSRNKFLIPVVALVVFALVGGLAFSFLRGNSGAATGSASPDDAVRDLVGSIANGDGLGVLTTLDPNEVQPLIDVFDAATEQFEDSFEQSDLTEQFAALGEFLPEDADLEGLIDGLEFHVGGLDGAELSLSSTQVDGDPDLARVTLDALEFSLTLERSPTAALAILDSDNPGDWYATQSFSLAEVPVGSRAAVQLINLGSKTSQVTVNALDDEFLEETIPVPLQLMTVRRNNRWYVSIGNTALDLAVAGGELDTPDYGAWQRVLDDPDSGADSAEGIVAGVVDSISAADFDKAIGFVDPDGDRLIHSIWSVARNEVPDDLEPDGIEVAEISTRLDTAGSSDLVLIDRLEVFDPNGDGFLLDGWCVQNGSRLDCIEDADLLDLLPAAPFFAVVEHDGRWFFSLAGTYQAWADHVVTVINESDTLQDLISEGLESVEDGFDTGLEDSFDPGFGDLESLAEEFGPITTGPVITTEGSASMTTGDNVVVAAITFPHVGSYTSDSADDPDSFNFVDFAGDQIDTGGFAVVEVESTESIDLALGSEWYGNNQVEDGKIVGLVMASAQTLRSVPVTVFPTPGRSVEVTVTATSIEPQLLAEFGAHTVTLDDNGLGFVVLVAKGGGSFSISGGLTTSAQYFGRAGGDVFVKGDGSADTGEVFGVQWLPIEGEPNAEVTIELSPDL